MSMQRYRAVIVIVSNGKDSCSGYVFCLSKEQLRLFFPGFITTWLRQFPPGSLSIVHGRFLAAPHKRSSPLTQAPLKAICLTFFCPCCAGKDGLRAFWGMQKKKKNMLLAVLLGNGRSLDVEITEQGSVSHVKGPFPYQCGQEAQH